MDRVDENLKASVRATERLSLWQCVGELKVRRVSLGVEVCFHESEKKAQGLHPDPMGLSAGLRLRWRSSMLSRVPKLVESKYLYANGPELRNCVQEVSESVPLCLTTKLEDDGSHGDLDTKIEQDQALRSVETIRVAAQECRAAGSEIALLRTAC